MSAWPSTHLLPGALNGNDRTFAKVLARKLHFQWTDTQLFYSPDKTAETRECQGNFLFPPQVSKSYPLDHIKAQLRNAAGQLAAWPKNACVELGLCVHLHFYSISL